MSSRVTNSGKTFATSSAINPYCNSPFVSCFIAKCDGTELEQPLTAQAHRLNVSFIARRRCSDAEPSLRIDQNRFTAGPDAGHVRTSDTSYERACQCGTCSYAHGVGFGGASHIVDVSVVASANQINAGIFANRSVVVAGAVRERADADGGIELATNVLLERRDSEGGVGIAGLVVSERVAAEGGVVVAPGIRNESTGSDGGVKGADLFGVSKGCGIDGGTERVVSDSGVGGAGGVVGERVRSDGGVGNATGTSTERVKPGWAFRARVPAIAETG